MKFTPASMACCSVFAASNAACASGSLDAHSPPPAAERYPESSRQRADDVEDELRLRRAERRGARLHGHRAREGPEDDRRTGPYELGERHARQRFGEELCAGGGDGHRRHRAGDAEGRNHSGLVVPGVDLQCPEHRGVPHQGRIRVDEAGDDGVRVHEPVAKGDLRHLHGVLRPLGSGYRAHERLVRVAQVAVDHVQVALVDRQVHRLAQGAAGVVQPGRQVCELHEVAEVFDCRVAPALVEVANERGAIRRHEHRVRATDACAPFRVARVLDELGRRRIGDEPPGETTRNPDPLTLNVGAGAAPERQCLGVVPELDADFLENRLRVVLDDLQALGGQHVVDRHAAGDVGHDGRSGLGARRTARLPAAAAGSTPSPPFARHHSTSVLRRPAYCAHRGPSIGTVGSRV